MRRIAFVIATLLSAPIVSAQPRRYQPDIQLPDNVRWQELLLRPTGSPDIDVVEFRGKGGRLSWLRISPTRGVERVDVEYVDRPTESYWTRWNRAHEQIIGLDRNARVRRIIVHCRPRHCGSYSVFAS